MYTSSLHRTDCYAVIRFVPILWGIEELKRPDKFDLLNSWLTTIEQVITAIKLDFTI